jgi:hypothetical protein
MRRLLLIGSILLVVFTAKAQSQRIPLDEKSLMEQMSKNKAEGKDLYHGVINQFVVNYKMIPFSTNDSITVINEFSKIKEVLNCNFRPSKGQLVVVGLKENLKITTIKQVLANYNTYIVDYKESMFKQ